jgi:hypothetical protein
LFSGITKPSEVGDFFALVSSLPAAMFYLFIYSTASFLSKIESKEGRKLHNFVILPKILKMKYRYRIPE